MRMRLMPLPITPKGLVRIKPSPGMLLPDRALWPQTLPTTLLVNKPPKRLASPPPIPELLGQGTVIPDPRAAKAKPSTRRLPPNSWQSKDFV